jgi:RNA polymerase sigma-70 factor (ECF subfamily)
MPRSEHKQLRFESLVRRFSPDEYRYAVWLNGDMSTAEDLVQETFMRAWRALDTLKDEASTKRWLFAILRRENSRLYERERPETGQIDTSRLGRTGLGSIPAPRRSCCAVRWRSFRWSIANRWCYS